MSNRIYTFIKILFLAAFISCIYYGWTYLKNPEYFPVKQVKIQGSFQHINQQALQEIITPYVNDGFFNFSASKLQQQLAQLPWVADINIQRVWPATIIIQISEQQAVAEWDNGVLINSAGVIFSPPANTFPPNLPALNSPTDQESVAWQYYQQILPVLSPLGLSIAEFDINSRQAVQLKLNNGIVLKLGKDDIGQRLQRFISVYPSLLSAQTANIISVDLRYDNGLAVAWRNDIK